MNATIVFRPTEDFFSEAFGSQYCKGLTYTLKPGNDRLARYLAEWVAKGMVTIDDPTVEKAGTQPAALGGVGEVTG